MGKVRDTFTLDEEVSQMLSVKVDNKSKLVNDLLKAVLFGEDEEEKLLDEIETLSKRIKAKKNKLYKIRDKRKKEAEIRAPIEKVLDWANEVGRENPITGERQPLVKSAIKIICRKHKVDYNLAITELNKLNYEIIG